MTDTQTIHVQISCIGENAKFPQEGVWVQTSHNTFCKFHDNQWWSILGITSSPDWWLDVRKDQIVMTKDDFDEEIKESAQDAWTNAANAYRLYPNNKHTFSAYWNNRHS